jgi:hypothetical protein
VPIKPATTDPRLRQRRFGATCWGSRAQFKTTDTTSITEIPRPSTSVIRHKSSIGLWTGMMQWRHHNALTSTRACGQVTAVNRHCATAALISQALVLASCASFSGAARDQFSKLATCPTDRVQVVNRTGFSSVL